MFLDLPRWRCLWQAITRLIRYRGEDATGRTVAILRSPGEVGRRLDQLRQGRGDVASVKSR